MGLKKYTKIWIWSDWIFFLIIYFFLFKYLSFHQKASSCVVGVELFDMWSVYIQKKFSVIYSSSGINYKKCQFDHNSRKNIKFYIFGAIRSSKDSVCLFRKRIKKYKQKWIYFLCCIFLHSRRSWEQIKKLFVLWKEEKKRVQFVRVLRKNFNPLSRIYKRFIPY